MVLMQIVKNNCFMFPGNVPGTPGRSDPCRRLRGAGAWRRSAFCRPAPPRDAAGEMLESRVSLCSGLSPQRPGREKAGGGDAPHRPSAGRPRAPDEERPSVPTPVLLTVSASASRPEPQHLPTEREAARPLPSGPWPVASFSPEPTAPTDAGSWGRAGQARGLAHFSGRLGRCCPPRLDPTSAQAQGAVVAVTVSAGDGGVLRDKRVTSPRALPTPVWPLCGAERRWRGWGWGAASPRPLSPSPSCASSREPSEGLLREAGYRHES